MRIMGKTDHICILYTVDAEIAVQHKDARLGTTKSQVVKESLSSLSASSSAGVGGCLYMSACALMSVCMCARGCVRARDRDTHLVINSRGEI